ncbi:MAG: hypothetical protein KatS3mg131_0580 [Candidatus Tectimicrobiota bacterium]|nr:MAG: hypothetical protein KatS3mg131_0580 [Candidatus Tectomicrobia bacterium]
MRLFKKGLEDGPSSASAAASAGGTGEPDGDLAQLYSICQTRTVAKGEVALNAENAAACALWILQGALALYAHEHAPMPLHRFPAGHLLGFFFPTSALDGKSQRGGQGLGA